MTSTMGCRTANPSGSGNRMMVVTATSSAHPVPRAIAISYSRLAQTLQSIRRTGGKIVSIAEGNAAPQPAPAIPANVTPIHTKAKSQVSEPPAETPAAKTAEEAPQKPAARSSRRRTAAKTQSTTAAKPKRARTTRAKRKRATG